MYKIAIFVGLVFGSMFLVPRVEAAIPFGTGTYVNLCGSGTAANVYSCNASCNVRTGSCAGTNNGVVKYTCNGRWDQCLESESYWSNSAEVGTAACAKTVQLSVFDKKCRLDDGSWDQTCKLLGYMVWYSGDCQTGVGTTPTLFPTSVPFSTIAAIPSPTARVGVGPTSSVRPSPTPTSRVGAICNKSCVLDSECGAGFKCLGGQCRNPACSTDASCFCGSVGTPATGSGGKKSPDTGGEQLIVLVGVMGVVGVGIFSKRMAGKIW